MEPIGVSTIVEGASGDIVLEAVGTMSATTSSPLDNFTVICKQALLDIFILVLIKYLAGVPPLGVSASREPASLFGEFREETSTSAAVDIAELDILYRDLPSYKPEPTGDSMATGEMRATLPSTEPITLPAESVGEMKVVP